jgi:cell wall assembly regulator SMI1
MVVKSTLKLSIAVIEIDDPGKPVAEKRLSNFEREIGATLPIEYRQFLLNFNGGSPAPDNVDIEGMPESPTDVQEFFGIGASDESSDLSWNKETFSDRIPTQMLPIACDSGGNLFCLSLANEDSGKVIYVDLQFIGEQKQQVSFYEVAENFNAFLDKIREEEKP